MTVVLRPEPADATSLAGLDIDGVTVTYGGHRAVDSVSLNARLGQITGLIGPNGAGKTSLFNAISGLVPPDGGSVRLFGRDLTRHSVAARARAGLGRTFQRMELVTAMTVRTNVTLGCAARSGGNHPLRQLMATSRQRSAIDAAVDDALATCGIDDLADRPVRILSTGQRRLVELARVIAGGFRFLLLDEPSSGLDERETDRFATILSAAVSDRGIGMLLVEHDIPLVMRVCERIYVLEFGRLIFSGTPQETQASPLVRAAYLGDDAGGVQG